MIEKNSKMNIQDLEIETKIGHPLRTATSIMNFFFFSSLAEGSFQFNENNGFHAAGRL